MSQETHSVDVTQNAEESPNFEAEPEVGTEADESSSVAYATRFGVGFVVGMFAGSIVGVALNSLALSIFGGFIVGSVLGTYYAER